MLVNEKRLPDPVPTDPTEFAALMVDIYAGVYAPCGKDDYEAINSDRCTVLRRLVEQLGYDLPIWEA